MAVRFSLGTMFAFLLVLARVAGLVAFLPLSAFKSVPMMIRAGLAFLITIALYPVWPHLPDASPQIGQLASWAFSEMGFGLVAGVSIAILNEGFQIGAQVLGMPAGFGYAQTIDPNSSAESSVLQVIMSLFTGLLFFSLGIDQHLLRVLAASFEKCPAGSWTIQAASVDQMIQLSAGMFSLGLRVALPVVALLLLLDVALALLSRMQQQLHLQSMSFPVKMVTAMGVLIAIAPMIPKLFSGAAMHTIDVLWRMAGF